MPFLGVCGSLISTPTSFSCRKQLSRRPPSRRQTAGRRTLSASKKNPILSAYCLQSSLHPRDLALPFPAFVGGDQRATCDALLLPRRPPVARTAPSCSVKILITIRAICPSPRTQLSVNFYLLFDTVVQICGARCLVSQSRYARAPAAANARPRQRFFWASPPPPVCCLHRCRSPATTVQLPPTGL